MTTVEWTRTSDRRRSAPAPMDRRKPRQTAQSYAVWLLSCRDYSASSLHGKLTARGYTEAEADQAVAFVVATELQSDERYAAGKARGTQHRAGNAKILMTLRQKGIDQDLAKAEVDKLSPEDARAIALVAKFASDVQTFGLTKKLRERVYRFLGYRRFGISSIKRAIESLEAANATRS